MIRTLIFGAIAGYVGKKLYDEGKLTEFKDDLVSRYNEARGNLSSRMDRTGSSLAGSSASSGVGSTSSAPSMPHGSSTATHSPSASIG